MNYILEQLAKTPPEQQREEAERLLRCFDSPYRGEIPRGGWDVSDIDWPKEPNIRRALDEQAQFFEELGQFLGNSYPQHFTHLRARFERNRAHMLSLTRMTEEQRRDLPAHEFFPFYDDFAGTLERSYKRGWSNLTARVEFVPDLIARGGWADIYRVHDQTGTPLVLKLFHTSHQRSRGDRYEPSHFARHAVENVRCNKDFLIQPMFAAPRLIPDAQFMEWYVMDYASGKSAEAILKQNPQAWQQEELTGRVFAAYADMLVCLHSQGRVFIDNAWSALVVDDMGFKVCDYDTVAELATLKQDRFPRYCHKEVYACREHLCHELPYTLSSDLESFALLMDEWYAGTPLLLGKTWEERSSYREQAKANKREYRMRQVLPGHLRQVVVPLLTYPRNDSITAQDVREAIRQTYRV